MSAKAGDERLKFNRRKSNTAFNFHPGYPIDFERSYTCGIEAKNIIFFKRRTLLVEQTPEEEGADSEGEGTEVNTPTSEELNLIVNVGCLQTIIGQLACPACHKTLLMVREGGKDFRHGSACYLEVCCRDCGKVSWDFTSKKSGSTHTGFDVNRRIVTTASSCGFSFSQIKRQFALMGMPQPMSESIWYFYKQKIHMGVKRAADKHLQEAANQIRRTYADMNIGLPNDAGVLNISVSIDGSWQKRGHSSHNGVVTVIETMTGLVVDFIALSNYCQGCESGPKPEDANYEQWAQDHRSKCQKNIHCSSGAMEMEGAMKIFERSVDLHGFRYTEMLGDGDAKTYKRVIEADPYESYPIEKLDTDDNHNHTMCPEGPSSWCSFNRAQASGVQPPPHDHPLPADIGEAIKPIYQRLALGIAVQKFNQGSTALLNILLELELMQNTRAAEYGEQEDVKRVNKATRRSSQQAQEKRKKIDDIRRRERQAFLAREGPAYGAGEY
ncbi:hypothetical protein ACOMHN_017143 [Nucella lapillus]